MSQPLTSPDVVCFGEILMDILPHKTLPGGAPMNVAYHLKKLGRRPALISRVGDDENGRELLQVLSTNRLDTAFVQKDNDQPTGMVYAKADSHHEMSYDIVQPVAWDFITADNTLTSMVAAARYFVFGSLTSRSPVSKATLFRLLEAAPVKVLDINLRQPHFNQTTVTDLLNKADVLKVNSAELRLLSGWFGGAGDAADQAKLLQDRFDIQTVIVTLGADGAFVNDVGHTYRQAAVQVQVTDTIGSGDSFLAGFLHRLLGGAAVPDALRFATGVGAFIASRPGGCPPYEAEEVTAFLKVNTSL